VRVRLESVGCRLNISEIESFARQLAGRGHRMAAPGEPADLCVLNTCTVTAVASRKSRQLIRRIRRANPAATVVVTGCYSELAPDQVDEIGVDLIIGNTEKDNLVDKLVSRGLIADVTGADQCEDSPVDTPEPGQRTRAFVKIQDGCDNRCTFCIVTIARGKGRSRPAGEVVDEIRHLLALGYREVVLSGVHLGSYGHDIGDRAGLQRLVDRLLDETTVERLRLSSLEPWDLESSFFDLFQTRRLLPHLHLPLQSGSDSILRKMARRTSRREFSDLVEAARVRVEDVAISTDMIVGFPGESPTDFEQSLELVESLEMSRLHVFRFSAREGTQAAALPNPTPSPEIDARSRAMLELGKRLETQFEKKFIGRTMQVLWETSEHDGPMCHLTGLTENYLKVTTTVPAHLALLNQISAARIVDRSPAALVGEVEHVVTHLPATNAGRRV